MLSLGTAGYTPMRTRVTAFSVGVIAWLSIAIAACSPARLRPEPHHAGIHRYPVGFQIHWANDPSRSFTTSIGTTSSRPIPVAVWYPSADDSSPDGFMTMGQLFRQLSTSGNRMTSRPFIDFISRLQEESFFRSTDGQYVAHAGVDVSHVRQAALSTVTASSHNTRPADGSFPVVIYHPGLGGNIFENASLCEQIASRGFVVASSSFLHNESWQPDPHCGAISTSLRDIDFLLGSHLPKLRYADPSRVGIVGHSFGAQVSLAAACQPDNKLRAVVSLDSTMDRASTEQIESPLYLHTSWHETLEAMTTRYDRCKADTLVVTSQSRDDQTGLRFQPVRRLIRSRITFAVVQTDVDHEEYLSQTGMARRAAMWSIGRQADNRTFESISSLVVDFLRQSFYGEPLPPPEAILLTAREPISPVSPSDAVLILDTAGISGLRDYYSDLYAESPRAVFAAVPVIDDLQKRAGAREALDFARFVLAHESVQGRWRVYAKQAEILESVGDIEPAVTAMRNALELCEDPDAASMLRSRLDRLSH